MLGDTLLQDRVAAMDRNPDSPWNPYTPVEISPTEFEEQVLSWLERSAAEQGLPIKATPQGIVSGAGGDYSIDVLLESTLFGASLLVLVECKHQRRPVERDELIVLEGKLRDVGAHKGMLFSTSGFQSGAIKYAAAHGIATVTVVSGQWLFETKGAGASPPPPSSLHFDRFEGIRLEPSATGISRHSVESDRVDALSEWFAQVKVEHRA